MRVTCLALASALVASSALGASAAPRCGWLENPSTGNWWVSDRAGMWILSTFGKPETKGIDRMPSFSQREFVTTYASHGYGCACVEAAFDRDKIATQIYSIRQLPLARCRGDSNLPKPGQ